MFLYHFENIDLKYLLCNLSDVGKAAARLVDFLDGQGTPLSSIHLIGFSLGAHAAGWSGATITVGKLARITGTYSVFTS